MSRRRFIEGLGATCKNWRWSWSFVNHSEQYVIFGSWDALQQRGIGMILKDSWHVNLASGRSQPGFTEAREYIDLVANHKYSLKVFLMQHGLADPSLADGPAKILGFEPELVDASLVRDGDKWLALLKQDSVQLPDEEEGEVSKSALLKATRKVVSVSRVERNGKARAACIAHYGTDCQVCGINFSNAYGDIGLGFIHVHHIDPIGDAEGEREVDPIKDLVPVCPNCHAMIHTRKPPYLVEELKRVIAEFK